MSELVITRSILLSWVCCVVTLLLVINPLHLSELFTTNSECLSMIATSILPFLDIGCLSFGIISGHSLLLALTYIYIDLFSSLALVISSSSARKKSILTSSDLFSWGPTPVIVLMPLLFTVTLTTISSKSVLYSETNLVTEIYENRLLYHSFLLLVLLHKY